MKKPLLSIGIIFKNEIRCLERCLKSLQPLRDALPCEVVMADTGATDGSRDVAERYADIVFDFPWINDFAAARNAVMERCSGEWYMTIDCDEWVDPNIEGFVAFLTTDKQFDFASVIIRNYSTPQLDEEGGYSDFLAVRLLRMSTGVRYEGTIHEHWPYAGDLRTMMIRNALFHHDGYAYQDPAKQKEKQERNMKLLREQLKQDPDNLIILTQCIESGDGLPEQEDYLRRAMAGVDEKWSQWELFGPVIYRYAVRYAIVKNLPELEEWLQAAEDKFSKSIFVRVEIAYYAFGAYWNKDDYAKSIYWGEKYLQGVEDYHAGNFDRADLLASTLYKTNAHSKLSVATVLASGYLHEKQPEKCLRLMETLSGHQMNAKQVGDCVRNLCNIHSHYSLDTAPLLLRLREEIGQPSPTQEQADARRAKFIQVGAEMFEGEFIRSEETETDVVRHAYATFRPLADKCELGIAAEMLETEEAPTLEALLGKAEKLERLPGHVLAHALRRGVRFPLQNRPLTIEQMDILSADIAREKDELYHLVRQADEAEIPDSIQELGWIRGLCLSALKLCPWKEIDEETGLLLSRAFARVEKAYLPVCYAKEVLNRENLFLLPPLHRFGWYCTQAFEALDTGDTAGYVRLLREGLAVCESAKSMVEFLLEHTSELKNPSDELRTMAEQIRAILSRFMPDDPAVTALKQSEAYQKVAYLIEGFEPPVVGGLPQ
ncbi:MAG: glycosyltransferase [Oscillospiraceae bacterium]|nr:glycosyltransferase [Oscillospiraceae bacterium]